MANPVVNRVQIAIAVAKSKAKKRQSLLLHRLETAYKAAVEDAEAMHAAELKSLDDVGALVLAELGGGEGEGDGGTTYSAISVPSRPPTWREAVLAALKAGPEDGMHLDDILTAVQAMGVTVKSTSRDPALMVDATLHALGDTVIRDGRRHWKLNHPESSPETVR